MSVLRTNLKERLARRDFVVGIHAKFSDADLVEALAPHCDFIFIDCENAGPDVETIPNLARAARVGGAVALLRPWSKDGGLLRRYLGCGIDGLILPDCESTEEVAQVRKLMADVVPSGATRRATTRLSCRCRSGCRAGAIIRRCATSRSV